MTTITIPSDYAYIGATCAIIGIVQLALGSGCMAYRKAFKSPEFLNKKKVIELQEEHKKSFGTPINDMGYPDMGNGRYSAELSYSQWVEFNNAQRAHYNMVESSGPVLAAMIVGGLFHPIACSILGNIYAIGMLIFSYGYKSKKGADGRMIGAALRTLSTLTLTGICFYNAAIASGFNFPKFN
mmetsp:Transcript_6018/g.6272  ORF Transcript_6018/g.6272 Transcript_6018/m.6272 type:complete len:183 (+) Transcript_6018:119-667(+)